MSSPDKAEMQRLLDQEWEALTSLVETFSDDELVEPGVVEEWSLKDLLGHMAFWADKAAADLRLLAAGRAEEIETPGSEEGTVEWNEREAGARKGRALDQVREEWRQSHADARSALQTVAESQLDGEVKGWTMRVRFVEDTYEHYKEHAGQIRAWQNEMETTEA